MITAPPVASVTAPAPAGEDVAWVFDPWREHTRTAALSALCAAGMCALVVAARLPFLVGVGIALFCVASLAPAITPVECRIHAGGAARRALLGWERRRWQDVRRVQDLPAGVLLSASAKPHWLDATRAMALPMPAARRAELRATVDALRNAHVR
jgi:hypothetical protein